MKQPILATVLGAGLLSASLPSSAYVVLAYEPEPRPTFVCLKEDTLCLQERKPYQVFAINAWKFREKTHKAKWEADLHKRSEAYLAEQQKKREAWEANK